MLSIDALQQQQQQQLIAIFRGHMHARGRGHCRHGKPCLSSDYALDSVRAEGSSIVVDAPESKARTGRFSRETLISSHGLFSSYEGQLRAANGQDSGELFRDAQGFEQLACAPLRQLKASTTMDLVFSCFLISA